MVRVFAHGSDGYVGSILHQWIQLQFGLFSRSSQCSTTGVTKAVVCTVILSVGKMHIKEPLLLIGKSSLCGGSGFPSKKCVYVTI